MGSYGVAASAASAWTRPAPTGSQGVPLQSVSQETLPTIPSKADSTLGRLSLPFIGMAVLLRIDSTCDWLSVGFFSIISAAMPAVSGVEKLVPDQKKYAAVAPWLPGATVHWPGASTSSCCPCAGMARLLKPATNASDSSAGPLAGSGSKPRSWVHQKAKLGAVVVPGLNCFVQPTAPHEITSGHAPGQPMPVSPRLPAEITTIMPAAMARSIAARSSVFGALPPMLILITVVPIRPLSLSMVT